MTEFGDAWLPTPITTERLVLREPEARDRPAIIELMSSPEVGTYVGGARPRAELERALPEEPARRPGLFAVGLDGAMIGIVTLDPRDPERSDHRRPDAGRRELGYLFLPSSWGHGYAAEACAAALAWYTECLPAEPVALTTQTANTPSLRLATKLGFIELERYEAWGAEQWLGTRYPSAPRSQKLPESSRPM
ncbi:GNAT family N-acetyltransferase [Kribbella sp. NPDC004875]|uniref:GNAT family N-acetyltransferase n=1 Tax=Kribbella sp. NPDC004875 TaxID=3364107 RepID=UPI0036C16EEA